MSEDANEGAAGELGPPVRKQAGRPLGKASAGGGVGTAGKAKRDFRKKSLQSETRWKAELRRRQQLLGEKRKKFRRDSWEA